MAQAPAEALPMVAEGPDEPGGSADQSQVHGELEGSAEKGSKYLPRGGFVYLVGTKTCTQSELLLRLAQPGSCLSCYCSCSCCPSLVLSWRLGPAPDVLREFSSTEWYPRAGFSF